ncbi:MAG: hypothetical protein KDC92_01525 [Bacteroidetes bacterium]|nr:hypothetical protein [Bacteroidota bacterium]
MKALIVFLFLFFGSLGQTIAQDIFLGEPKTLLSYHKEHQVWENGKKTEAKSKVNVEFKIFMSDSFISISEPDTLFQFKIVEFEKDKYANYTFTTEKGHKIQYFRTSSLVAVLWKGNGVIDNYYL